MFISHRHQAASRSCDVKSSLNPENIKQREKGQPALSISLCVTTRSAAQTTHLERGVAVKGTWR